MADAPDQFTFDDLLDLYLHWEPEGGRPAYEDISAILHVAQERHRAAWERRTGGRGDHGQSWRAWKGKNFESLVREIVCDNVRSLNSAYSAGIDIATDTMLNRTQLDATLSRVKRNLAIDYGEHGLHLPDADVVLYKPATAQVVCIVSCKVTMRERIAQTAYWKLKLNGNPVTRHIQVSFVTPDEDEDLRTRPDPPKKGYAIVNTDVDVAYLLCASFEETHHIKRFSEFASDLLEWSSNMSAVGGGGQVIVYGLSSRHQHRRGDSICT